MSGSSAFNPEPEKLLIRDLREDFDFIATDLVHVFIDSLHDRRSDSLRGESRRGASAIRRSRRRRATNQDWDGVWDAKVTLGDHAWFVEVVIPFKTLRFSAAQSQEWGMNLTRRCTATRKAIWAPVPDQRSAQPGGHGRHPARISRTFVRVGT